MKVKLKRLVYNRKGVSQQRFGGKFNKHQMPISRQIKKLVISNYAREKSQYFCFNDDSMPGSVRYYTNDKAQCSDDVRFIEKGKYPKKILMLIAISHRGISKPYFRLSKSVARNTDIYISECMQPKLLEFITVTSTIYFGPI